MAAIFEVLFQFAIGGVLIWFIFFIWKIGKRWFLARNVPNISFVKHLWIHFIVGKEIPQIMSEMSPKPLYSLFIFIFPTYVVACPKFIRNVLNSNKFMNKHYIYDSFDSWDQGLVTSTVHTWKKHHKLISPSFSKQAINWFAHIFDEHTNVLIDILSEKAGVKNFDFSGVLLRNNLTTIFKTMLDLDVNIQGAQSEIVDVFEKIWELQNYRLIRPWLYNYYVWKLSWNGRQYYHAINKFNDLLRIEMKKKIKMSENETEQKTPKVEKDSKPNRAAFLGSLIENSSISEEELRGEIHTFAVAGTETLSTTFCYILIVLGMFKDIQSTVYDEVKEIFGNERPITIEGLSKMSYSEMVIKETMRVFPVLGLIGRDNAEDVKFGDTLIPKGSGVVLNIFMLHRNPKYWPDPLKFDPDRFLPEEVAKRDPYTYLPFSLGPRMCIGSRYAMLHLKMLLAKIVRKFKIHTEYKTIEEVKLIYWLIMRLKDGEKVWLELR